MGKMFRAVRSAVRKYFVNSCFIDKKVIVKIIKRSLPGKRCGKYAGATITACPLFLVFRYFQALHITVVLCDVRQLIMKKARLTVWVKAQTAKRYINTA